MPLAPFTIIVRGIERKAIFMDDTDPDDFLDRVEFINPLGAGIVVDLARLTCPCFSPIIDKLVSMVIM